MPEPIQLATQEMRPDAGFHADQARRHVGKSLLELTARYLLAQRDRAGGVHADQVKRVLADIDPDGAHNGFG
jgi:hypothetical protein